MTKAHIWTDDKSVIEDGKLKINLGTMSEKDNDYCVVDIDNFEHILLSGVSGCGKTSELKAIARQCVLNEADVMLFDRTGLEFPEWDDCCEIISSPGEAVSVACEIQEEVIRRRKLLHAYEKPNIVAYNESHKDSPLVRKVLIFDELKLFISGLSEVERNKFTNAMYDIASRSRGIGIHIIIATRYPEEMVGEVGKVRTCIPLRMCGFVSRPIQAEYALGTRFKMEKWDLEKGLFRTNINDHIKVKGFIYEEKGNEKVEQGESMAR